jgi:hypothetical protein
VNGGWRLHLLCCAVLACQFGLWLAGHRSQAELVRELGEASPEQRIEALFLLLERAAPAPGLPMGPELAELLLGSADPLEVEFACTTSVCKHAGPERQYRSLKEQMERGAITPGFWRAFVLLRRKIGVVVGSSSGRLKRKELQWWLDALAERPLRAEEVLEHVRENP